MDLDDYMTDMISVRKETGEKVDGLKALVQAKGIFMSYSGVLIEPGDLIERRMSNGGVETFEVIDPCFHESALGQPAFYKLQVRKLGLPEAKERVENITYNISGHNARINNHSVDNSTNSVTTSPEMKEYIDGLRLMIQTLEDAKAKEQALEIVGAVEMQLATPKPSKTVVSALLNALPHAASIATLVSAIIAAL